MLYDTANESAVSLLPEGTYRFVVVHGEVKRFEAKVTMISTLEVVEGPAKGEQLKVRFGIVNPGKTQSERINKADLKKFMSAIGVNEPIVQDADFNRLTLGKTLLGEVKHSGDFANLRNPQSDQPGVGSSQPARNGQAVDRVPF